MMRPLLLILLVPFFLGKEAFSRCTLGDNLSAIVVDSVSVNPTGEIVICWQPSGDPDIAYYTIYMVNPLTGANDSIDFVDSGVFCYTLPVTAPENNFDSRSNQYGIVAVDTCANPSPLGTNYHNTIFLEDSVDICEESIFLSWNSYNDFNSGEDVRYEVFVSEEGGPFTSLGTTADSTFSFTSVNGPFTYRFFVRAIENGGAGPYTSSSNLIAVNADFLKNPEFTYLYTATVVSDQQIDVEFYIDTSADIVSYSIERSQGAGATYTQVGSVNTSPGMAPRIVYSDMTVDAAAFSYTYKISAINQCQDVKQESNIGKSILLTVVPDKVTATNTLIWTPYENWAGGVLEYAIYRAVSGVWETTPFYTSPSTSTTYLDNLSGITNGNGEFCYRIEAREVDFAHVGDLPLAATSASNEVCVVHDPILYVPTAFRPSGTSNPLFKPSLIYADTETYVLSIYTLWGEKIFETADIDMGWDGSYDNSGSGRQTGVYVYKVEFKSPDGRTYNEAGRVTLLD